MTVILNMKKPYDHSTSEDVRNLAEATFIAVEPFLQPIKKHEKLNLFRGFQYFYKNFMLFLDFQKLQLNSNCFKLILFKK